MTTRCKRGSCRGEKSSSLFQQPISWAAPISTDPGFDPFPWKFVHGTRSKLVWPSGFRWFSVAKQTRNPCDARDWSLRAAHNPEAAGSSPAAATIKDLKSRDFRSFLSFLAGKSWAQKVGQTSDPLFDPFWWKKAYLLRLFLLWNVLIVYSEISFSWLCCWLQVEHSEEAFAAFSISSMSNNLSYAEQHTPDI